jgi:hypothetical protein
MHKYSGVEIKKMLEFLMDNIFVGGGDQAFRQSAANPMGTNRAPCLWTNVCIHTGRSLFKSKTPCLAFNSIC